MKIVLIKEYLTRALHQLNRIAKTNNNLPVLSSVLLEAKKSQLLIKATNLEVGVILSINASIKEKGSVAVPLRLLLSAIENIDDEKVAIQKKENGIEIETKTIKTKIKGIDVKEFPIIPKVKEGEFINVNGIKISEAIEAISPAIAVSNIRPDLASIFIKIEEKDLKVVATDGFRLAEKTIKKIESAKKTKHESVIIPSQAASEISHILKDINENMNFSIEENQISINGEGIYFVSRIIDGNYPDYKQIIPKDFKSELIVEKNELQKAIKLVSLFSDVDSSDIKLKAESKKEKLTIMAKSGKTGEGQKNISIKSSGENFEVVLNYRYFMDGVNSIKEDKLKLSIERQNSTVLIKPFKKEDSFLYLLSPISKD